MTDPALSCSPFFAELLRRHPDWWSALQDGGRLQTDAPPNTEHLNTFIASVGVDQGLRDFRNFEMMRIVWRELNRAAQPEQTMADLSELARLCLQAALEHHQAELTERFGTPRSASGEPQSLAVLALGKLGGAELNLSSDIDLVFAFPEAGECDGRKRLSCTEFFTRLVRAVVRQLSEVTDAGFCFRVDIRLRPFGAAGPLVSSFGAMEQYYQREGRDWERYAWVKARPVAGDLEAGARLLQRLSPFVYRRYIDFGAVEALHEMHGSLRAEAARKDRANDIKRGPGGIREIEFLVQAFQLLRGGREHSLQTPSLLQALKALGSLQILPIETVQAVRCDYLYLRQLENAIQALHDQQQHELPTGDDLTRVARAMRCTDGEALMRQLAPVRQRVQQQIDASFPRQDGASHGEAGQNGARHEEDSAQPTAGDGQQAGQAGEAAAQQRQKAARRQWVDLQTIAADPDTLETAPESHETTPLQGFARALARQTLSRRAAERLDEFMPKLLAELDQVKPENSAVRNILALVLAITRRSAYLSLLVHNPPALARMVRLFAASDWLAARVIRYPALLDELIDPALGRVLPDREEMQTTASRVMDTHQDAELALQSLNHVKRAFTLRIAVAELENTLDARAVQFSLTALAETLVTCCLQLARAALEKRHGQLPGEALTVIGYGTLGAAELGYESDLDLVFLYETNEALSDGPRPLAAEPWYTALVRRLLSLLTATTASGRLFEVDTRLRPNGKAGLLVSSSAAFARYQQQQAWTWELQALSRGRPCAGAPAPGQAFMEVRQQVLQKTRPEAGLRQDLADMRERLRRAHTTGEPLKHGPGGLLDIDFVAQLGVLLMAPKLPPVLQVHGTREQLQALADGGWLTPQAHQTLVGAFDQLNRARHLLLLARDPVAASVDVRDCAHVCAGILQTPPAEDRQGEGH